MTGCRDRQPPGLAAAIVGLCSTPTDREVILGDLEEEFRSRRERHSVAAARRWYWDQALRSTQPLLAWKLATAPSARVVSGLIAGSATAIASATLLGILFQNLLGSGVDAATPLITIVVTTCALFTSTCAGCASLWATGRRSRLVLAAVGLVVVAPDLIHALLHSHAKSWPWALLPVVFAAAAAHSGLRLGGRLWRLSTEQGGTP